MKTSPTALALLSALALWFIAATPATPPTSPLSTQDAALPVVPVPDGVRADMQPQVTDLDFLAGVWSGSDGQSDWESSYTTGAGGQLVGASKEMRMGKVVMMDFEHFYERDGSMRMTPYPFGKPSVEFTLTDFDAAERMAVFENPEHDFPKRFVYQRTSATTLEITLQGSLGGDDASFLMTLTKQDV